MQMGTIARWEKKEGDKINEGDLIAEVFWGHRLCCISIELHRASWVLSLVAQIWGLRSWIPADAVGNKWLTAFQTRLLLFFFLSRSGT